MTEASRTWHTKKRWWGVGALALALALVLALVLGLAVAGVAGFDAADAPPTAATQSGQQESFSEPEANPAATEGTYGSDSALDALQDECEAGGMAACEGLYQDSPLGSQYEATAKKQLGDSTRADPEPGPRPSTSQQTAVSKAQEYLGYSSFSRSGLIEELEYEGFSGSDAEFAANRITLSWRTQAADKAQEHLDYSTFSRSGLIEQLEYEGFSAAQAAFGVNAAGLR